MHYYSSIISTEYLSQARACKLATTASRGTNWIMHLIKSEHAPSSVQKICTPTKHLEHEGGGNTAAGPERVDLNSKGQREL